MSSDARHPDTLSEPGAHLTRSRATFGHTTGMRRADIEGLRGIGVLALLAVHVFPGSGVGGGVGIDIFFVISGFLTTQSLLTAFDGGSRGLSSFYARRLDAIVPPLCVMLIACLLFGWLFTTPTVLMDLGRSAASAAFSLSNVMPWRDESAVTLGPNGSPLFHLWAVALMVQWCVVWSLVLRFLIARNISLVAVTGGTCVVSFLITSGWVNTHTDAAFFLLPTRAWEPMLGALLACLGRESANKNVLWLKAQLTRRPPLAVRLPDALAWSGAILLVLSVLLFSRADHVPGWWAMLPASATFALLAAGPAWVNRCVLSQPVLRFYGAISYPLFLWHWPMLSFALVMGAPLTSELRVIILVTSVVLATLTYTPSERRKPRVTGWNRSSARLAAGLIGIGLVGSITFIARGFPAYFPDGVHGAIATDQR